jgi:hypothetical protein
MVDYMVGMGYLGLQMKDSDRTAKRLQSPKANIDHKNLRSSAVDLNLGCLNNPENHDGFAGIVRLI